MKIKKTKIVDTQLITCYNDDNTLMSENMYDSCGRKQGLVILYGKHNQN